MQQATQIQTGAGSDEVPSRGVAGVFDLLVSRDSETRGWGEDRDAIGGFTGIAWWQFYRDALTNELYRVHCSDGVNGGHGPRSDKDEVFLNACFQHLSERFRRAARNGDSVIRVSRNERYLMQNFTHATLFESADRRCDGKQSNDGLNGGLVGHHQGIPVMCDLELPDDLPPRSYKD